MHLSFNIPKLAFIIISLNFIFSCSNKKSENYKPTVEVKYNDGRAQLYRHGKPYQIIGAGGTQHLDRVAEYGGNSIRTWSLHDAQRILDEAHELGLTVTLGLEIGRPHWGNEFSFWNFWEVSEKIEELRPFIEKFKDHPALLMWGVGNEVDRFGGGRRFLFYYSINRVAKMVKKVDPNHPTMTAVGYNSSRRISKWIRKIMPHIDILGINLFKSDVKIHDEDFEQKRWGKAYILSEWGPNGHWSSAQTEWGAPIEPKNSDKRQFMEKQWDILNNDSDLFLGSYVFYWGFKHEATHTWFSLFSKDGAETESIHFLKDAWAGKKTENLAPQVEDLFIESKKGLQNKNVYLESSQVYTALAYTNDPEGDTLSYKWEIRAEENYFVDEIKLTDVNLAYYNMEYLIQKVDGNKIKFNAPKEEGAYRIFIFAYDGKGNVASYNIPFYVIVK
jgi:hypothetical protein